MARKKKGFGEAPKLEMTPMIDVVFQLLIFFIVTIKVEDILSHLDISRPAPDPNAKPESQVEDLLNIMVYDAKTQGGGEGVSINSSKVRFNELERQLIRLGRMNPKISVIIKCTEESPHQNLVKVLDICSKAGLKNLSVFSM